MGSLIFHLDLDSFFVSAERLKRPELVGKCVAVGGSGGRGVISSCSYEARKLGVRSAMPTVQALRLCPELILCDGDYSFYSKLSSQVFSIIPKFTPVFEAVSIDEGYLDMSGSEGLLGPPLKASEALRSEIYRQTGLTASVGIASNRVVAKIATDTCKPNGQVHVLEGQEAEFLAPFKVGRIPGCGRASEAWLHQRGIFTIGELQKFPLEVLERHLGKMGEYLHRSAWGKGSTAFNEEPKVRTTSRERTFEKDISDRAQIRSLL